MMIEALILALDGVIFETEEMQLQACNAALAESGLALRLSLTQYREAAHLHGASHALTAVFQALPAARARELQKQAQRQFHLRVQELPPARLAGCAALMDEALKHGCKLAVVTDMPAQCANALLQHAYGNDVNNTFGVVLAGARYNNTGGNGPHQLAMRTLGIGPEQCVAIDAAFPALQAARSAGIRTIAATPHGHAAYGLSGDDLSYAQMLQLRDLIRHRDAGARSLSVPRRPVKAPGRTAVAVSPSRPGA